MERRKREKRKGTMEERKREMKVAVREKLVRVRESSAEECWEIFRGNVPGMKVDADSYVPHNFLNITVFFIMRNSADFRQLFVVPMRNFARMHLCVHTQSA